MKSPIASIIGNTIQKMLSESDDNAERVYGVKKIASPTPNKVIPTKKNHIPLRIIRTIAKNSEIIIRKNIPFDKMKIKTRFRIAIIKAKLNPISKMLLLPAKAKAK